VICKSPNDNYAYTINWAAELGADTINASPGGSTWTAEAGITIDSETNDTTTTTIDLSGGTSGKTYQLTNQINTVGGDVYEKNIYITIQNQLVG
jgi:hypothetical protein